MRKTYDKRGESDARKNPHVSSCEIDAPWRTTNVIRDDRGNFKQICAEGTAKISVSKQFEHFYGVYGGTIMSRMLGSIVERFGWQYLKPDSEAAFKDYISKSLDGVEVLGYGLELVKESDLEPTFQQKGNNLEFKQIGSERKIFRNVESIFNADGIAHGGSQLGDY